MTRVFVRVPVFDRPEDAVEWCAEHGATCDPNRPESMPRLHTRPGGDVVGTVEVFE